MVQPGKVNVNTLNPEVPKTYAKARMTPQYKKESSSSEEAKAQPSVVTVDIQTLDLNKPLINSETAKKTKPAT